MGLSYLVMVPFGVYTEGTSRSVCMCSRPSGRGGGGIAPSAKR